MFKKIATNVVCKFGANQKGCRGQMAGLLFFFNLNFLSVKLVTSFCIHSKTNQCVILCKSHGFGTGTVFFLFLKIFSIDLFFSWWILNNVFRDYFRTCDLNKKKDLLKQTSRLVRYFQKCCLFYFTMLWHLFIYVKTTLHFISCLYLDKIKKHMTYFIKIDLVIIFIVY